MKKLFCFFIAISLCLVTILNVSALDLEKLSDKKVYKQFNEKNTPKNNVVLRSVYEPNDSLEEAYTMSGDILYSTIGYEDDWDFFKKNFTQGQEIVVSLRDIPSGCDYDLYLCDSEGYVINYSDYGENSDEIIFYEVPTTDDYIIVIIPYDGYNSSEDYRLYAGDETKTDSDSVWVTGISNLSLSSINTFSSAANFDLTNETSIPSTAEVTSVYLYGSYVGNFGNKTLQAKTAASSWEDANLSDIISSNLDGETVRQNWYVRWKVQTIYQTPLWWEPEVLIHYDYTYHDY